MIFIGIAAPRPLPEREETRSARSWQHGAGPAPENAPPESSGTGFFVYGLAWGIEAGLLDRATFEPAVLRGWQALERAVDADGRLGWVQQVSDRPEQVAQSDTQFYGVGALLLAGSAVLDLYE